MVDVDDPDEAVVELSVETALVDVDEPAEVVVVLSVEVALADVDDLAVAVVELSVEPEGELELGPDATNLAPKTPL